MAEMVRDRLLRDEQALLFSRLLLSAKKFV